MTVLRSWILYLFCGNTWHSLVMFYRKYAEKVSKSLSDCSLHYFECFVYHFMLIITSGITWQNDNKNLPIVFWSFLNVKLVTWPIILKHIHCWLLLAHICYEKIAHKSKIAKLTNFEFFFKWRHSDRKWSKLVPSMTEWPNDHFLSYLRQKAYSGGILKWLILYAKVITF